MKLALDWKMVCWKFIYLVGLKKDKLKKLSRKRPEDPKKQKENMW